MKNLSKQQVDQFNEALNEATLIGAELLESAASLTFEVLTLPPGGGPSPADSRVQFILEDVSRILASLREGYWNDGNAPLTSFSVEELMETVLAFQSPVYGGEFLDCPEDAQFQSWSARPSLDWRGDNGSGTHRLEIFQEHANPDRHLDICFWFEGLRIFNPERKEIPFDEFTAGGVRWWDAMYEGDPRTGGHGIQPLRND